ncbi:MAG: universal stress protein [Bacteroidales bacterium]|jgi:nucleotide-binding universal stress UspA family protein|nr:universal stress protein [Bacteroidales bacterium]
MENLSKLILIPTDFSDVVPCAVELAANLAKKTNARLVLLHIVKKPADILDATAKVTLEAEHFSEEYGMKIEGIVRKGSIFSTIADTVKELDAFVVVMGTHGVKGMQKLTGSWSLKVVVTSSVPFIVVQEKKDDIKRIVFPIDFKKENLEKIGWVHFVASLFDANVYIFREKVEKDKKIEQKIRSNLIFTEKFLNSKKIYYQVEVAEGKQSFAIETLQYAKQLKADLIVITTPKDISKSDYLLGRIEEEGIIDNSTKIPVMCINPRPAKLVGGFRAMGSI